MSLAIGWFSSGRDEAACQLLEVVRDSINRGEIPGAHISYVFSNRAEGESVMSDRFFALVRRSGIPLICKSSRRCAPELHREGSRRAREGDERLLHQWRITYDREVLASLPPRPADVVLLAGYMLILGPELCGRLPAINLHPALPGGPRGTWQEVIWQLIAQRAEQTGAMVHRVTAALDAGPPLSCWSFSLRTSTYRSLWDDMDRKRVARGLAHVRSAEGEAEPLFRAIRQDEVRREMPLLVKTLGGLARGRITLPDAEVVIDGVRGRTLWFHDDGDPTWVSERVR